MAAITTGIALTLAALLLFGKAGAAELYGRVVAVADGDTVTVGDTSFAQHRIRLSAIDAPERRQAWGEHARRHLATLVSGRSVLVSWDKRDRYGRIVGRVYTVACARPECGYTFDVGLEQIRVGLAWHYRDYAREQPPLERARYAATELAARVRHDGLWSDARPVPPWEFRRPAGERQRSSSPAPLSPG